MQEQRTMQQPTDIKILQLSVDQADKHDDTIHKAEIYTSRVSAGQ